MSTAKRRDAKSSAGMALYVTPHGPLNLFT